MSVPRDHNRDDVADVVERVGNQRERREANGEHELNHTKRRRQQRRDGKGDIFAHWQLNDTGPIPLNDESSSFEGLSFGKFGISSKEIEKGQVILNENFSGGRDYFINLIFEESP